MTEEQKAYASCRLCPRRCGAARTQGQTGVCGMDDTPRVACSMLHKWEEPFLSGTRGSGAVFFSGCSLGCVYCQNRAISRGKVGKPMDALSLCNLFLSLEEQGAHNLNLVTASHFLPSVRQALLFAKEQGFSLPVVYNTSGYETVEAIASLKGLVDIFLTDLRYARRETATLYSAASDYPDAARSALAQMVKQTGGPKIDGDGLLKRGTVVRLLLLPTHLIEAKMNLKHLWDTYGDEVYVSLMRQYTPMDGVPSPLDRPVSDGEYLSLVRYAETLGVKNAFTQEKGSISESFIPPFEV
ncbi:MAG: radical SAM protein [Clostridia bacterium]|nr:radical SAM protein [Clostridia bacterium]